MIRRNCNHFTETLAMALIMTEPPPHDKARLQSYPQWLNRLANTGAMVGVHIPTTGNSTTNNNQQQRQPSSTPCQILQEATVAAGF